MEHDPLLKTAIEKRAEKLGRLCSGGINELKISIEAPRGRGDGNYVVKLHLALTEGVSPLFRQERRDVHAAIRAVFAAARREVGQTVDRRTDHRDRDSIRWPSHAPNPLMGT